MKRWSGIRYIRNFYTVHPYEYLLELKVNLDSLYTNVVNETLSKHKFKEGFYCTSFNWSIKYPYLDKITLTDEKWELFEMKYKMKLK